MLLPIIGFTLGLFLPGWYSNKMKAIEYEDQLDKVARYYECKKMIERACTASGYLEKIEKKSQLYCMENDKICEKLLKEYQKGSKNVSWDNWHDIVVPLSKKVQFQKK